jgi:hypothetical protein
MEQSIAFFISKDLFNSYFSIIYKNALAISNHSKWTDETRLTTLPRDKLNSKKTVKRVAAVDIEPKRQRLRLGTYFNWF